MIRERFETLTDQILGALKPDEDALLHLGAESSDFVRFNHGKVRQPGHVVHGQLTLRLVRGQRHAAVSFNVGTDADSHNATEALGHLRQLLDVVPEDPHLLWEQEGTSSEHIQSGSAESAERIVEGVVEAAQDVDLVGILAAGDMASGFANSRGQRNWDQRHGWLLDWCLYNQGDKAVKSTMGGTSFDAEALSARITAGEERLQLLKRPARKLTPGDYRVFLTPAAMGELMDLLCRDGFSHRAHQSHASALGRLGREETRLSPMVHVSEDIAGGLSPTFNGEGFQRPQTQRLIHEGGMVGTLVSPRSAREYSIPTTGASPWEAPEALSMGGGELAEADALEALGTGLYISNLWYLNYSDHPQGRITGMTRFATLWVEDGVPVAPTEVMRFDDTLYHLLGDGLQALTREVQMLPSASTYGMRSTSSQRLPGALIEGMTFTL